MENYKEIVFELDNQELVIVRLLVFYFCLVEEFKFEIVDKGGIEIKLSPGFIRKQLEKINKSTIRLKFPTGFKKLIDLIFGLNPKNIIFTSEDLVGIEDLGCLENLKIIGNQLKTEFNLNPIFEDRVERYLSIDLGIKNPVTVVDSLTGQCLILGRDYMSRSYYFDKKIKELENKYIIHGLDDFNTKKMKQLNVKKANTLQDILHKITRFITNYCKDKDINRVVVGEIKEKPGSPFPFNKFFKQLEKKLKTVGVKTVKQNEYLTSQCPPDSPEVSEEFAVKQNRITRGLFKDGKDKYNADGLGAFNILRSYLSDLGKQLEIPLTGIISPTVITVSD